MVRQLTLKLNEMELSYEKEKNQKEIWQKKIRQVQLILVL
jgi:hypothetical protein